MNEGRSAFLAGPRDSGKQNSRSWLLVSKPLPVTCPRVSGPSWDISDRWMWLIIIFPHHKPLPMALMLEEQRCWKREWRWTGRVQAEAQMAGWHLLTWDVLNMSQLHRHKLCVIYNVLVAWSCLTLWDPMDCSPPGSSVCGILQARVLEWVAIPSSRGPSWLRDQTWSPALQADSLPPEPQGKSKQI